MSNDQIFTTAGHLLHRAAAIVGGARRRAHGPPERSFGKIAAYWSTYLGVPVSPVQVCQMMILLKVARGAKEDDCLDAAGYAALCWEVSEGREDHEG